MINLTKYQFLKIFFIFVLFKLSAPARILCYNSHPFYSHQSVQRTLTDELARRGHELVIVSALRHDKQHPNVTEIDVEQISFDIWEQVTQEKINEIKESFTLNIIDSWKNDVYLRQSKMIDAQLGTKEVQALINDDTQKFDVIIVEPCIQGSFALAAKFKAPIIFVSTFFGSVRDFQVMGGTTHPLLFPDFSSPKTHSYNFLDKIKGIYIDLALQYIGWQMEDEWNRIIRKHIGPDAPTIAEMKKNVHMMFLNMHPIWDNNRPVPPSVVYMGALNIKKPNPLPSDLQSYLDAAKDGVIFMSLGSKIRASDLPKKTIDVLFKVFASVPYSILLKWNAEKPADLPANVRLMPWVPQNDLLHHPNMKAFITHAGLQSTDEAIAAKVPLIGVPVFADQFYNADQYVRFGIGHHLDIDNLDADELRNAIISVAQDKSYRENITKLSKIMEEQRIGGLEKAMYWIEYVAEHGGAMHLRSPLADATFVERNCLDVIGAVVAIVILAFVVIFYIFKQALRFMYTIRLSVKLKSS